MRMPSATTLLAAGGVALLLNSGYVGAFADATIFYMANVLAHLLLGVAVAVLAGVVAARDAELRRRLGPALPFFAIALAFGLWLAWRGNLLEHAWALTAHIVAAALGVAALMPYAVRLARSGGGRRTAGVAVIAAAAVALALPLATSAYARRYPPPNHRIVNPPTAPLSMAGEGGGPSSPFFPSSARTNVGGIIPANFFMDSDRCGECHTDIYEQWKGSMHHFASFNNQFYRKSIEYMQSVVGTQPSKWCAGCHDHAVFFNGRFETPIAEQIDTPEARAGLACTSCHAITHVDSSMGNGGFTIDYPPLHELATSRNPYIRRLDRFLTYLNPEPHRRTFMKPFMREDSAEFCAACHKVHLDEPVNQYRWFRGFNDYDNWQASGVSGQGARSFYYPAKPQTCVDCHMARVPSSDPGRHADKTVHSHRFAAANTAVPFVNHDQTQLKAVEDFLTSGFISVDIFSVSPVDERREGARMIRRASDVPQALSGSGAGEEAEPSGPVFIRDVGDVAAPIDKAAPPLAPGSTVRVDVVVRTRAIGHFFPGGTLDAFDVWLELQGADADGRVIYWSGRLRDGDTGPVDEGAHFYRSLQLDAHGNPIDKRNAFQARSVLYVRSIPPGAADVAHYRVRIPKDARGPITLTAKLNYRKFSHYYTQFAFAGVAREPSRITPHANDSTYSFDPADIPANVSSRITDRIPDLPVVVLARATATLPIGDGRSPPAWTPVAEKADRERWNDWGIGLLLQGDLRGAQYAFTKVTEAEPEYADGWLNVARALIQEGETDAAKPFIARAMAIDATLARVHFFKAMIEKADGDYPAAIASLERVTGQYPRDRVALNQLARVRFLQRDYTGALDVLTRVFAVDPEDLQGHYTAMLAHRGAGNDAAAEREQQLFTRFKAEESSQAITGARRLLKPEENNERQAIHEHESGPLGGPAAPPVAQASPAAQAPGIVFRDVTAAAGIRFTHNSGRAGRKYLPETLGSGAAFFDADADGWPDIVFVNSRDWTPRGRRSTGALYRNNRDGTFTDITAGSGLDVEMYGLGVAAGDYDNDGRTDLYITALEGDRLFRNEGRGRFRDVTKAAGIANADFGTSAAFVDYDKDGRLDLFVANYVRWTAKGDLWCSLDGATKSYCTPESYTGTASKLYRNLGGGRFEDASRKAGVDDATSKSLGVTVLDYNLDGWPDLFVANDTQPNKLYRNNRNGTFTDAGMLAGVAYSEEGIARGAMGVDSADYDRSGRPHLLVGNFSNQMLGLYYNEGRGLFVDEAPRSTVGRASLLSLAFGVFFFDYDLDGYADILAANGHIEEAITRVQPKVGFAQPPLLFRNLRQRRFENASGSVGAAFARPIVARGAAYADIDRDGDLDVLLTTNHGPAVLFRNDGGNANRFLTVRVKGVASNRDGIGAVVRVESASGRQWSLVRSGSSYASQSDLAVTFGLARDAIVTAVEVEWPSGAKDRVTNVGVDQFVTIEEGKGLIAAVAGTRRSPPR